MACPTPIQSRGALHQSRDNYQQHIPPQTLGNQRKTVVAPKCDVKGTPPCSRWRDVQGIRQMVAEPCSDVMSPVIFCFSFNASSILILGRQILIIFIGFAASAACLIIPLYQNRIDRFIHLVLPLRISNPSLPEFQQGLLVNAEALGYLRAGLSNNA